MKARKIFLLLFILAFGTSVETAWHLRGHVRFDPLGWRVLGGRFYGPSFSFEESQTVPVPSGASVVVENSFGGVKLVKGGHGEARVSLRKVVFLPTEGEARTVADRVKLRAVMDGATLRLSTNRGDLERNGSLGEAGLETHWEVAIPEDATAKVSNEHGSIDVRDVAGADVDGSFEPITIERIAGNAAVKGRHGDIHVSSVGGAVSLSGRHGDVVLTEVAGAANVDVEHGDVRAERTGRLSVGLKHGDLEVEGVRGDLEVRGEHSAAKVTDVSGNARVETSFDDVHVNRVTGDARVKTEHGSVEIRDVRGAVAVEAAFDGVTLRSIGGHADVKVEHGGVDAQGLAGGAVVQVSGDDVSIEGFRGGVRVQARRGSIRLAPDDPVTEPVTATTDHGGIAFGVPPGSRFELSAAARPGNVSVNLPGFVASESGASKVAGHVGQGGGAVTLEAQHGDVTVETRAPSASKRD